IFGLRERGYWIRCRGSAAHAAIQVWIIRVRRTMRTLWLFRMIALGAALSISAEATVAASKEEWKFIFAMASTDWDVRRGTAVLERSKLVLQWQDVSSIRPAW